MSILHIGYPKAASTSLQFNVFAHAQGHLYISRKNNGAPETFEPIYDSISNIMLSGGPISEARKILEGATKGRQYIYSDERILIPFGKKRTSLVRRAFASREIFGDVDVLLIIRNPVEQIMSLYKHVAIDQMKQYGTSIDVSLDQWIDEKLNSRFWCPGEETQGLHFGKLTAIYCELFGSDRVHPYFFDDIKADEAGFYARIVQQFGIDLGESGIGNRTMNTTSGKFHLRKLQRQPDSRFDATLGGNSRRILAELFEQEFDIFRKYKNMNTPQCWK